MRLGEVASIRSGLVLSRKLAKEPTEYRYRLLNLRSIHPKGYVDPDQLDVYDAKEPLGSEYLTRSGDIIVRLSAPYTAVLIDQSTENLVVSSNFVLIRTEQNALLPEYLHWLLNTEKVNRRIYENATTNMLSAVKAKYFVDFEFAQLPLEQQRAVADMYQTMQKELRLLTELAEEKEKYYTRAIELAQDNMKRGL